MTWAKFDDRYDDNRKVKKAWRLDPASVGLHAMAITYSSRHETDGIVDLDWLTEKLPVARARVKTIAALVECELFEPIDGDRFRVHDYLKFNPSIEQLSAKRRKDSERKAQLQRPFVIAVRAAPSRTRARPAKTATAPTAAPKSSSTPDSSTAPTAAPPNRKARSAPPSATASATTRTRCATCPPAGNPSGRR
jgi:hypothetical protein